MLRISGVYLRQDTRNIPVYTVDGEQAAQEMEAMLKSKRATITREYSQFGIEFDVTWEVVKIAASENEPERLIAIMTITPGGEIERTRKGARRGKR